VLSVSVTIEGWDQIRESLGAARVRVLPTMLATMRRGLWLHAIPQTKDAVAYQSGIGNAIWGRDQSGLGKQGLVSHGKLIYLGEGKGETALKLRGIPALLEDGGRVREHVIRNGFGRKGKPMRHPGMTLRAHRFGQDAVEKGLAEIQTEVDQAICEMLRRRGL
jgi:hypothetical protein